MSRATLGWIGEIILVIVCGYFSLWFALLSIVTVGSILQRIEYSQMVSGEVILSSIVYFIVWILFTYLAAIAMAAARRGGEWRWR
jgi:hypothetical protein